MRQLQEELDNRKEMLKKMGEEIEKSGDAGEIRLSLYQKKNNLTVQLNQAERLIEAKEEQSSLQKKAGIYNRTLFESKRKLSSGKRSIRKRVPSVPGYAGRNSCRRAERRNGMSGLWFSSSSGSCRKM